MRSLLSESTIEVDSTTNAFQLREASDNVKGGVVGNVESTSDHREHWEGDVCKLAVADEGQVVTNLSKVSCGDVLESARVEADGAVDGSERRCRELGAVGNAHVLCPDQVGEVDGELPVVAVDVNGIGDIADLHADGHEIAVVVDLHAIGDLKVNPVQRGELSVGDVQRPDLLQTSGEGQGPESGKRNPIDGIALGKKRHAQICERGHGSELESAFNLLEVRGGDASNSRRVGDEVAVDGRNAVEGDGAGGCVGNFETSLDGRAASERRRVAGVLNGHSLAICPALGCKELSQPCRLC